MTQGKKFVQFSWWSSPFSKRADFRAFLMGPWVLSSIPTPCGRYNGVYLTSTFRSVMKFFHKFAVKEAPLSDVRVWLKPWCFIHPFRNAFAHSGADADLRGMAVQNRLVVSRQVSKYLYPSWETGRGPHMSTRTCDILWSGTEKRPLFTMAFVGLTCLQIWHFFVKTSTSFFMVGQK